MENQVENLPQLVSEHESEGQHDSAVQLCKKTLGELKQAKGNDHPDVAKVFKILEQVYLNQIKHNESKFGPNNHKVALTLSKLGDLHYELNKFGDAESAYHRALVIMEKIYKENDPEIEKVLWRLAYACRHQEKYDEAEFYLKDSLAICETIGPSKVAKRTLDLGNLYMQKGDLQAAEQTYNEALKIFTNKLRSRDLIIGHNKYDLAKCLAKQERFQEAVKYFKEASIIYQSKEEELHLADSHLGLGCCFLDQGKYEESTKYLQSALTLLTKPPQDPKNLKVADVYFNLGLCFSGRKGNKKAESAYSHAVNIYTEKLGENNLQLAEPMFNLANCLMTRGQHKKAEEYLSRLLKLHKKNPIIGKLKAEDTKCRLIKCLMKQGKYQEANEHLKAGSILGQETLKATIKFNLGNCFLDAGNYQESVELYHEALSILEIQKKENDLMVADIKYNLALALTHLNRIKEAQGFYLGSLSLYTKELKPNDTHLCNVKINLGNCYLTQKEWKFAQECYMMVLEVYKSGLGFDDSDVAEAKKNVGLCFFNQKCIKEALCYFEEAKILFDENSRTDEEIITDFQKANSSWWFKQERVKYFLTDLFPPYSLKSAKNKTILGDCYYKHGKFSGAYKCYKECVKFYKSPSVDMNEDVADALRYLGDRLKEQGKYKDAEESYREALEIYEKHLKDTDELIIAGIKFNIAWCLSEQGNRIGAVEYYKSSLANYEKRPICLLFAHAKFNIGNEYRLLGKWDMAEKWYRESLELYRSLPGNRNEDVARALRFLGHCLKDQGKLKEAEESLRGSLEIYEKHLKDTDELIIADIKFNIAWCLSNQGNRIGAVEYWESACAHYEKRPICLDFAHAKFNIGDQYRLLEKWDMAEKWYRESLKLYRSLPGDRNQDIAKVLRYLGKCLRYQGKYKDAEESSREALEIYEKHLKDTDELIIANIKFNIAWCLSDQGNRIGAVEYWESACAHYEKRPICLDFAHAKYNIGDQYRLLEKWDVAEKWYRESLKLYRSLPGDRNQDIAKVLRYLGKCLRYQGKYKDAEESSREALEIYEKHVQDTDELIIADIKFDISWCLSKQGNSIGAVEYWESSLANYEKRPICLNFAHAKYSIGLEYWRLEKWDKAEKWYRESLKLYRSLPGDVNQHVAKALRYIGECLREQGKHKDPEELLSYNKIQYNISTGDLELLFGTEA